MSPSGRLAGLSISFAALDVYISLRREGLCMSGKFQVFPKTSEFFLPES